MIIIEGMSSNDNYKYNDDKLSKSFITIKTMESE
jgi:hypothetical protein